VISCYFEENTINEFHARLRAALGSTGRSFELVFVNDGSTDGTFEQLRAIFERDETVTAILDLSRNFGQGNAIAAGIREASGEAVLLLDSDLQLDPEDASKLLDTFFAQDLDVVTGYRMNRRDSISRRLPSLLANVIMRRISRHALRDFGCTFTVLNAHIVRSLWRDESWTYRLTDIAAQTRRVAEIAVNHHPRPNGKSGWTFRKLWSYNMDNLGLS
jgi:glycosyltransferase involved in cell wall biosynthesis